jgi:hypothetical protein
MTAPEQAYIAPKRTKIKDAVEKLLPQVPRGLVRRLDYWALYSLHQDITKSGMNPETAARKYVKGYDPEKIRQAKEREIARKAREKEALRKKAEVKKKQAQARAAAAAKAKARAARTKSKR